MRTETKMKKAEMPLKLYSFHLKPRQFELENVQFIFEVILWKFYERTAKLHNTWYKL